MSLLKIREERKQLGSAVKRGPQTIALVVLLIFVLAFITYLGGFS